ncbi:hypothetical protein SAMN05216262_11157 [Colwellia chukchiensis]|uniref:Polyketide cyclase / dehydrase and lipid transport n=1 Tax=Colwellia chukchiensis TaxID=641665 RepID=A0A1H7QEC4_9GAMM|nr:hypothetical protein [Colwellia chukchiensis]SEL45647.1 hypothetical protein SAMN05216262_11157 [Colwellia chukchiensis]
MRILILLLALCPLFNQATVITSNEQSFTINIDIVVNADKMQAYQKFLNIGQWWSAEHTWFGKAENLSIDARVGGCFCERAGEKQAMHMRVSYLAPGQEIKMLGGLGPLQMMAVNGAMSWKFEQINAKQTKITFYYHVVGYLDGGLNKLAPIVDKVQQLQLTRLRRFINTGNADAS